MYPIGGARRTESNDANPEKGGGHGNGLHSLVKHYPECEVRKKGTRRGESGCSRAGGRGAVVSGEKSVRRPARDLVVCREDVRGEKGGGKRECRGGSRQKVTACSTSGDKDRAARRVFCNKRTMARGSCLIGHNLGPRSIIGVGKLPSRVGKQRITTRLLSS